MARVHQRKVKFTFAERYVFVPKGKAFKSVLVNVECGKQDEMCVSLLGIL